MVDGLALALQVRRSGVTTYPYGATLPSATPGQAAAVDTEVAALLDANDALSDVLLAEVGSPGGPRQPRSRRREPGQLGARGPAGTRRRTDAALGQGAHASRRAAARGRSRPARLACPGHPRDAPRDRAAGPERVARRAAPASCGRRMPRARRRPGRWGTGRGARHAGGARAAAARPARHAHDRARASARRARRPRAAPRPRVGHAARRCRAPDRLHGAPARRHTALVLRGRAARRRAAVAPPALAPARSVRHDPSGHGRDVARRPGVDG